MNDNTLLHRQVHPKWIQDGRITSQVFHPTPKDERLLSVYDGDLIGAQEAWEHFVRVLKCSSVGVMAVTVKECTTQQLSVRSEPTPYPQHAVIDFAQLSNKDVERKAKHLRAAAVTRGWQYEAS